MYNKFIFKTLFVTGLLITFGCLNFNIANATTYISGTIEPSLLTRAESTYLDLKKIATGHYTLTGFKADGKTAKTIDITDHQTIKILNDLLTRKARHFDDYQAKKTNLQNRFNNLKSEFNLLKRAYAKLNAAVEDNPTHALHDQSKVVVDTGFATLEHVGKLLTDINAELGKSDPKVPTGRASPPPDLTMISDLDTRIKSIASFYENAKTAYAQYLSARTVYAREQAGLRLLKVVISNPLQAKPLVGSILSETIRDANAVSQELALRRSEKMSGVWLSGNMPFAETDVKFHHSLKAESTNAHFTLGYDTIINKEIAVGGFFGYADNELSLKSGSLTQDKSSFNFGVYGLYAINEQYYLGDKLSYNHNTYDNAINHGDYHSKSNVDFNSWNNELTAGYIVQNDLNIETYWNLIYTISDTFNEQEVAITTPMTTRVSLDSTFYNSIGARAFYMMDTPISENFKLQPYAQSFIEIALTGKELKAKFMTNILPTVGYLPTTFEKLDTVTYGLTTGFMYQPEGMSEFKFNLAYQLTHFANTAHTINLTGNWSL